jgi:hypothetical protein
MKQEQMGKKKQVRCALPVRYVQRLNSAIPRDSATVRTATSPVALAYQRENSPSSHTRTPGELTLSNDSCLLSPFISQRQCLVSI